MSPLRAKIQAVRCALPTQTLTNEDLSRQFPEWQVAKIAQKTGIDRRAIAAEGECSSDLGVRAAQKLFDDGVCLPEEIDFLLFCTQSPDYPLPSTACLVQHRLGLPTHCGALDFNLGCSGFVYGLSLAQGLIETGAARRVLLITAETYSKFIHPTDKTVRTIFGDGAAACLIESVEAEAPQLGPFVFGTDGRGAENLIVRAGGMRSARGTEPAPVTGVTSPDSYLHMNGPEIMTFTLRAVPEAFRALLDRAGVRREEIDYFIFHQANRFMLDTLRLKLELPEEKFAVCMDAFGNTVSATIPMAYEVSLATGRIKPGDRVMYLGFGVGYSWAACLATV